RGSASVGPFFLIHSNPENPSGRPVQQTRQMAILHPFAATRPTAESAKDVSSVPYDVVSVAEARALARGNPRSFLHVVRPEINFDGDIDEHDDRVYAAGAEQLRRFVAADYTVTDPEPGLYIYRLVMD